MKKKITDKLDIENIILLYNGGLTSSQIGNIYSVDRHIISNLLKRNNIPLRDVSHAKRTYSINEDFFEEANTEAKAYVLGLLYADGHLDIKNKALKISLTESDKEILEQIASAFGTDKPIKYKSPRKDRYSKKGQYELSIINKKIADDLIRIGFCNRSTIPVCITQVLMPHFIRGYFDGDGCISINKSKRCNGYECEFFIMGEETFIGSIKDFMYAQGICLSEPKHVKSSMFKIRKGGPLSMIKIYNFLYKDATIYLQRKYDKFAALLSNK